MNANVIGAGPAGLSAAIGLARSGVRVTVHEQRTHWQPRVCGAFMNPEAVAHLSWLGPLEELSATAVRVNHVDVTYGAWRRAVPVGFGRWPALAIPRLAMEASLMRHARELGVDFHFGHRVRANELTPDDSITVFADGRFSGAPACSVRDGHEAQNQGRRDESGWYGWNATFENVDREPGHMSLNFYRAGYVGTLTFADGRTNVCGLVRRAADEPVSWQRVYERAIEGSPALNELLRGARRDDDWRGVGPLPFARTLRDAGQRAMCVGDAGAVGDPFMGEGNGRALGAGPLLYAALREATNSASVTALPRIYGDHWRRAYNARFHIGHWFRAALARPVLFSCLARLLLANPWLLERATPHFHVGFLIETEGLS